MSEFTGNWVDKIGSIIPGYKGYKDKEMRRDTDRILRNAIVKLLSDKRPVLDRAIADLMKGGKLEHLERLNQIKRKLDNAGTQIRTAPQGYSGWFDTVQVKGEDLDRLYQFDLGLREKAAQIVGLVDGLAAAKDTAGACSATLAALQDLEDLIRQRDHVIAEAR